MPTLYLYIPETLADWEPGHVLAELRSGRYLKDPSLRYDVVLCGSTMETIKTMGGIRLAPELLFSDISPGDRDLLVLPGADTWLDPGTAARSSKPCVNSWNRERSLPRSAAPLSALRMPVFWTTGRTRATIRQH